MLRSCQQAALQAGAVFHMPDGTERLTGSPVFAVCMTRRAHTALHRPGVILWASSM
jgi:hypothetical protein